MKRTAADFAREALDEPFELVINTGRSDRSVFPLPLSDMTYEQNKEIARLTGLWASAYNDSLESGSSVVPKTPDGAPEMEPVEFRMRVRFGALAAREPTAGDPRAFVAESSTASRAADYELFRKHIWGPLPWTQVSRLVEAVDEHYDPDPSTDLERARAAGAKLLHQCHALLEGADVDSPQVTEMLSRIAEVMEKAEAAAGKSGTAAG